VAVTLGAVPGVVNRSSGIPPLGQTGRVTEAAAPRAYEEVIEHIRELLVNGDVQAGDRLPPERDLAEALGVSRPMVREALRTLEVLGVVAARRGQGPGAGTFILSEPSPALELLLDMEFTLERFDLADVIDSRVMLEQWAIAGVPADADLTEAAYALTMMGEPLDRDELMQWDLAFHQAIVDCAPNRLVAHLYRSLRGAMHQRLADSLAGIEDDAWAPFWRRIMREHRLIYAALDSGDLDGAAQLSERHVTRHYLRRR